MNLLKFGIGNAKLPSDIATFSLPAGYTCPGACDCLSRANRVTGKITDGPDTLFRCYAASGEALYPPVREARWHNLDLLKSSSSPVSLILNSLEQLPRKVKRIRVHDSGDFTSLDYVRSWVKVALYRPDLLFYWYTKSIPLWLEVRCLIGDGYTPGHVKNVVVSASLGGKYDSIALANKLRTVRVVKSPEEARELGLNIDHDDSLASSYGSDYALLIHGVQPAGTEFGKAIQLLKKRTKQGNGAYGYSRKNGVSLPVLN